MIRSLHLPVLLLPLLASPFAEGEDPKDGGASTGTPAEASAPRPAQLPAESLLVERGEGHLPLRIPAAEELQYRVLVDLGVGSVNVGTVTLSSGVEPYRSGLPLPGAKAGGEKKSGWVKSRAHGGHLGYELDHELKTTYQPVDFPRVFHRDTQSGSENRKREIKIGEREDGTVSSYQDDGHCQGCERQEHFVSSTLPWGSDHHCEGCKRGEHRVWTEIERRDVPPETLDMLGAIYLSRTVLVQKLDRTTFPMLDKTKLWNVTLRPGTTKAFNTKAGRFDCREILLETARPEGEPVDEDDFAGIFGIRGEIHIWADPQTGVPVMIVGEVPVGNLFDLEVSVELTGYRGTPEAFTPEKQ